MYRIVAVTPAGRRRYLEILSKYILCDTSIDAWELWDNCRDQADRQYMHALAYKHNKISIREIPQSDGSNRAINRYYRMACEPDVFYIKMDDDLVWLPDNFGKRLFDVALQERCQYLWWSPLVINNAICTWLIKYHTPSNIPANVSAQAGCAVAWASGVFAENLHGQFLGFLERGTVPRFDIPRQALSLSRFSINCIGFFGEDVARLGERFCPENVDDEEWLSAVLPSLEVKPGRIASDILAAHFSFYVQEEHLLKTNVLRRYAAVAGIAQEDRPVSGTRFPRMLPLFGARRRMKRRLLSRLLTGNQPLDVLLREGFSSGQCSTASKVKFASREHVGQTSHKHD